MNEILEFIIVNVIILFVIGNIIACFLGAYPRKFEKIPYNKEQQNKMIMLKNIIKDDPEDIQIHLQTGIEYTRHNDIKKAKKHLDKCYAENKENGRILAWWTSNQLKHIGAKIDLTFGIWKLQQISKMINLLDKAVQMNSDDFTIRLIRLATLTELDRKCFDVIFEDEKVFEKIIGNGTIPEEITKEFYTAMTKAYKIRSKRDKKHKKEYLEKSEQYRKKLNS